MLTNRQMPNIVFVVLDTQRSDRLGCYGYPRGTTPHLDAFAQRATVFGNAISPAQWTIPSHASMFTGEPPSTHLTLQSNDALHPSFVTLAEQLGALGYRRTGICNNPLVGLLNNNLKRGFQDFYNYCGTVQSRAPDPLRMLWRQDIFGVLRYTLRQIVAPIQDAFGRYSQVFQAALNPLCVPLWTRFARFKGDTPRSIRDATRFISQRLGKDGQPHFVFINLMEPHLPYSPPDRFIQAFVPYLRKDRAAHHFMRTFNRQALHWLTPTAQPFSELESRTLDDMYDAEVAYQDYLLAQLLSVLDQPEHQDNTMVILVGDHGEMLGERQYMGHGFGVYRELVHVPLIIRWPGQTRGRGIATTVSTTRLFHTVLEAAGTEACTTSDRHAVDIRRTQWVRDQSLRNETTQAGARDQTVVSEAYAPAFAVRAMEKHKPTLIAPLACRSTHWAVYEDSHKLIHIQNTRDELYNLADDPMEQCMLHVNGGNQRVRRLRSRLQTFLEQAGARRVKDHRPGGSDAPKVDLEDKLVQDRLRGLGYIE